MVGISKLYCGTVEPSDPLRYGRLSSTLPVRLLQFSMDRKPVVVWNIGQRCNLFCRHCYSGSEDKVYEHELSTYEGKRLLDDLSSYGVPVVLFSGGEPLMRPDCYELIAYASELGLRTVLSTNGTLITSNVARLLNHLGLAYVGISLDGLEETHDRFRGSQGAFARAMKGLENCQEAGLKVGLRFTIQKGNAQDIPGIFNLAEEREIPRVCFYHMVYTGRGQNWQRLSLGQGQTRMVVDQIIDLTKDMFQRGIYKEILTVDNHTDAIYIYLRLKNEDPVRAAQVQSLLQMNEGNRSGEGIGCISWDGTVYADQFLRRYPLGNVRERAFSSIWEDTSHPFLAKLINKKQLITGRCSKCAYLSLCGGNFRARAEALTGDIWASDPACYLTDEEIGLS